MTPKVNQLESKRRPKGANGIQIHPNGSEEGAKGEPKGDRNASKSRPSKKVAKVTEKGRFPD